MSNLISVADADALTALVLEKDPRDEKSNWTPHNSPLQNHKWRHTIPINMPRTAKVSVKNTKDAILTAYQELLSEASSEKPTSPDPVTEKIISAAAGESPEKITVDLSQLRLSLNKSLIQLADQLTAAGERYANLTQAIKLAETELKEVHQIRAEAISLRQLVELHQRKQKEFEAEEGEYHRQLQLTRTREEEEYSYQISLRKKRDSDSAEAEKQARAQMVKELEEHRKKVVAFPQELDRAIKEAVAVETKRLTSEAGTRTDFAKAVAESDTKLAVARIASLESTIASQTTEVNDLKKRLDDAYRNLTNLASTVAESGKPLLPQTPPKP